MASFTYTECKICGEKEVEPSHFWKEHHFKEADYCITHEPRYSKLTGSIIRFKSRDFYFSNDFNDKNELKKWLKTNPDKALDYALDIIERRFKSGKIVYAPSQVEMRSICAPNILWYQKFCNYNLECMGMGLRNRFVYNVDESDFVIKRPFKGKISIDTREQKPLNFAFLGLNEVVEKLDYGDYSAKYSKHNHIFFERKGLSDFVSTVSGGYERFCKEIERAQSQNNYLIILVESSLNEALAFNMLPYISRKIKASPDFVFHRVRDLMQAYPNIQFVFADGRVKAAELIQKIYSLNQNPTDLDLQYLLDKKLL